MKDWYSPGEIRFKVREALWLIQNLESLHAGHWPPDASNYVDIAGRRGGSHKAPFETAADYYIEITDRLEKCGIDGLILEAIESWGKSIPSLAKYLNLEDYTIRRKRKLALGYVASGPARRWHNTKKRAKESYSDFKQRKGKRSSRNPRV